MPNPFVIPNMVAWSCAVSDKYEKGGSINQLLFKVVLNFITCFWLQVGLKFTERDNMSPLSLMWSVCTCAWNRKAIHSKQLPDHIKKYIMTLYIVHARTNLLHANQRACNTTNVRFSMNYREASNFGGSKFRRKMNFGD